jgi:hypothetical protein
MNPEKLLSRHSLKNGLALEFWDLSKPMVGDRWQVVVEARVAVAVTADTLPADLRAQEGQISAALGAEVVFTKQEVRTFVAADEMADILKLIQEQLLVSLRAYLGHPDFAARFIRKKFTDQQREKGRYH